jgi:hypothetical protein
MQRSITISSSQETATTIRSPSPRQVQGKKNAIPLGPFLFSGKDVPSRFEEYFVSRPATGRLVPLRTTSPVIFLTLFHGNMFINPKSLTCRKTA